MRVRQRPTEHSAADVQKQKDAVRMAVRQQDSVECTGVEQQDNADCMNVGQQKQAETHGRAAAKRAERMRSHGLCCEQQHHLYY
jgi:hypothetical protein